MVLRAFGRSGIESRIREHCRLAGLLARQVACEPGFELAPSSMSVVCFRCADDARDVEETDRLNQSIVEAVNASGRAYLTHTRLRGRTVMRVGFGNVLTTERHLGILWEQVLAERGRLAASLRLPPEAR